MQSFIPKIKFDKVVHLVGLAYEMLFTYRKISRFSLIFRYATVHIRHTEHSTGLPFQYCRVSSSCDEGLGLNSYDTGFVSTQCHPLT